MSRSGIHRARLAGLVLAAGLVLGFGPPARAAEPDGAAVYQRCAACHLPSRAGVPGAFPPLQNDVAALAGTAEGRRYLVLVLARGLTGPIRVEGKRYMGTMPAQAMLSAEEAAAVLNHLTRAKVRFTAEEVTRLRASGAGLGPAQVAQLNARLKAGR